MPIKNITHIAMGFLCAFTFVSGLTACSNESSVTPQSDFYQWVNQKWFTENEIPSDKPGTNNFINIQKQVADDIKSIVKSKQSETQLSEDEAKLIHQYNAFTNLEQRNGLGLKPIEAELAQINNINDLKALSDTLAHLYKIGVSIPYGFTVMADFKDSSNQILYIGQGDLGLKRDNYIEDDERSKKIRSQYTKLLTKLFTLSGSQKPSEEAQAVLELETALAKIQWSDTKNRDLSKIYNPKPIVELKSILSNLDYDAQKEVIGLPDAKQIIVAQIDYLESLNILIKQSSLDSWKHYLTAQLLLGYSKYLSIDFVNAVTDYEIARGLYDKPLSDDDKAIQHLNEYLGQLVGKLYVENTFDENVKKDVNAIIKNIMDEYRIAFQESKRLTPPTKKKALEKLDKLRFYVGYPDVWQDYSPLDLKAGQLVENVKRITEYELNREMSRFNKSQDSNEWDYPPQTVNAYYQPTANSFTILAGILYPPFYSKDGSLAQKYGSIGFIIGHEIGHGFDDTGRQFDGDGNLKNWWAEEDVKRYQASKNALIAQANAFEVMPGVHAKGELEIGEVLGDKSGSEIAFRVFKKLIEKDPSVDKKEAYRTFFENLATTWRSKLRPQFQLLILESDPHPPAPFRTNGIVVHFDEFHEAFDVKLDDPMYLPPEQRVHVW